MRSSSYFSRGGGRSDTALAAVARRDTDALAELLARHGAAAWRLASVVAPAHAEAAAGAGIGWAVLEVCAGAGDRPFRHLVLEGTRTCALTLADRAGKLDGGGTALGTLPERCRSALWLLEVERLTADEAAPIIGTSPETVTGLAADGRAAVVGARCASASVGAPTACQEAITALAKPARRRARTIDTHIAGCLRCTDVAASVSQLGASLRPSVPAAPPLVRGQASSRELRRAQREAAKIVDATPCAGEVRPALDPAHAPAVIVDVAATASASAPPPVQLEVGRDTPAGVVVPAARPGLRPEIVAAPSTEPVPAPGSRRRRSAARASEAVEAAHRADAEVAPPLPPERATVVPAAGPVGAPLAAVTDRPDPWVASMIGAAHKSRRSSVVSELRRRERASRGGPRAKALVGAAAMIFAFGAVGGIILTSGRSPQLRELAGAAGSDAPETLQLNSDAAPPSIDPDITVVTPSTASPASNGGSPVNASPSAATSPGAVRSPAAVAQLASSDSQAPSDSSLSAPASNAPASSQPTSGPAPSPAPQPQQQPQPQQTPAQTPSTTSTTQPPSGQTSGQDPSQSPAPSSPAPSQEPSTTSTTQPPPPPPSSGSSGCIGITLPLCPT